MRPLLSFALLVLFSSGAFAQQTQPKNFTLHVTEVDIVTIGRALEAMPYRDVVQLFAKLQSQLNEQAKQEQKKPEPEPAAPEQK